MRSLSVIVITGNRPELLRDSLRALEPQLGPADELIVVDSSSDDRTVRLLAAEFPRARLARTRVRNMPFSRNLGLGLAQGEVVAFVDDDALVEPGWRAALLEPYEDPTVGGVGGEVREPGSEIDAGPVGVVSPRGYVEGNFATTRTEPVEVDHVQGCNMSFRRSVLDRVRGFDPRFVTGLREETDVCFGVRRLGFKLIFHPRARVFHLRKGVLSGLSPADKRRLPRFQYYYGQSTALLYAKHRRFTGPAWRRFVIYDTVDQWRALRADTTVSAAGCLRLLGANVAGKLIGYALGLVGPRHGALPPPDRQGGGGTVLAAKARQGAIP